MNDEPMTHEIARGFAAAFVLGALEPAEEAAVREHLRICLEPHNEFAELGGVVPYLGDLPDLELVEPPPSLRDRIMAAAAADLAERTAITPAAPAPPPPIATPAAPAAPPAETPGFSRSQPSAPPAATTSGSRSVRSSWRHGESWAKFFRHGRA